MKVVLVRLVSESNGRSSIHKCRRVIKDLREYGYKDGDPIPLEDLEYCIQVSCGLHPRTVRHYLRVMEELDYVRAHDGAKRVFAKSVISVRTKHGWTLREYQAEKGWSSYMFGARAPHLYQETLNPKYVKPKPPSQTTTKE
jgi:hypothetical protein